MDTITGAAAPALAVLAAWISHPALWATVIAIGLAGEGVKRIVGPTAGKKGWRGVFEVTMFAHPMLVGAAVGLIPGLPRPESFGTETAGGVLFYLSGGVLAVIAYDAVKRGLLAAIERFGGA